MVWWLLRTVIEAAPAAVVRRPPRSGIGAADTRTIQSLLRATMGTAAALLARPSWPDVMAIPATVVRRLVPGTRCCALRPRGQWTLAGRRRRAADRGPGPRLRG